MRLTKPQKHILKSSLDSKVFLRGAAGTGKTTAGVARLEQMLKAGVPAGEILFVTPQRTLQEPYLAVMRSPETLPGGEVTPATVGGLARRVVDLFWPLAGEMGGFAHPDLPPVFLTLETAQYYMAHLVRPKLEEGYFESVTMDRNRLYSQLLDNLGKAASVGFDYRLIGEILTSAWNGDPAQKRVYQDVQSCVNLFREYCLENNLLDFSLQMELFSKLWWNEPVVKNYLENTYRHLIYDNCEEDTPVAHDIFLDWLPSFKSSLIIYDDGAGFRQFLGADPESGLRFINPSDEVVEFPESFVVSPAVASLSNSLFSAITRNPLDEAGDVREALGFFPARFYPQMLDWVAQEIYTLINEQGVPPGEIVALAPYLSDALRFSLMNRLEALGVPARSHRPSRSLRDEPAAQALLTLAELAHPQWEMRPGRFDIGYMFMQAIEGMDLVRAQLLAEIVYRPREAAFSAFEQIKPEMQERITYLLGARFSYLRDWLEDYKLGAPLPLDHFLRKLFGEVLSQPGFGFHRNFDSARVAAELIESIQKFRLAMEPVSPVDMEIGREYIAMLRDGVIAAQYVSAWSVEREDAVLVAPAYTFLMMNRPVTVQFWLDAGSGGWSERLFQPLTHPYVLSRRWTAGKLWTDTDETEANNLALARLVTGLLSRCRERVYLGLAELGETGFEQRGELLRAFQVALQASEGEG